MPDLTGDRTPDPTTDLNVGPTLDAEGGSEQKRRAGEEKGRAGRRAHRRARVAAEQEADALTARQYGAIARRQAVSLGVTRARIEDRLLTGVWLQTEARGVLRQRRLGSHPPASPDGRLPGRWREGGGLPPQRGGASGLRPSPEGAAGDGAAQPERPISGRRRAPLAPPGRRPHDVDYRIEQVYKEDLWPWSTRLRSLLDEFFAATDSAA